MGKTKKRQISCASVLIMQPAVLPDADIIWSRRQAVWELLKPWTRIALIMYLS